MGNRLITRAIKTSGKYFQVQLYVSTDIYTFLVHFIEFLIVVFTFFMHFNHNILNTKGEKSIKPALKHLQLHVSFYFNKNHQLVY